MEVHPLSRRVLEDLWRLRLSDAQERFDLARTYSKEVRRAFAHAPANTQGVSALERALCAEKAALAHYVRVLRVFADLVIDDIVPNEDDWQRRHVAHRLVA